jgi:hypothetical protein
MGGDVALTVEGKRGVGEEQSQLSMSLCQAKALKGCD